MSPMPLASIVKKLVTLGKILDHIEKRKKDKYVVEAMAVINSLKNLKSEGDIRVALEKVNSYIKTFYGMERYLDFNVERDEEHDCFRVAVNSKESGVAYRTIIDKDFLASPEFKEIKVLCQSITAIGSAPYKVETGTDEVEVSHYQALVDVVMSQGKKGLYIQRYKGLGEMNPDQLWDTTMNPDNRTLLQVKVEDTVAADEMFTILMGDQVEPRKNFIDTNALNVRNLDV